MHMFMLVNSWIFSGFFLQEVPEGNKDSSGGPWEFIALLPLFDPPRHDSAETIRRALELGVSVKMITGMLHKIFTNYQHILVSSTYQKF